MDSIHVLIECYRILCANRLLLLILLLSDTQLATDSEAIPLLGMGLILMCFHSWSAISDVCSADDTLFFMCDAFILPKTDFSRTDEFISLID